MSLVDTAYFVQTGGDDAIEAVVTELDVSTAEVREWWVV